MNKYQKAFERLYLHTEQLQKFQVMDCPAFNKGSYEEDKKLISELVDKATSKKPIFLKKEPKDFYKIVRCPICSTDIVLMFYQQNKYCSECGQALDWSEEND